MYSFNDFKKLHTFIVAAQYLSFSKAANELFITQAAVSQQINNLEQQLGLKLFYRLTRKLALTKEGEQLLLEVNKPFEQIKSSIDKLSTTKISKTLTVSMLPSLSMKWLVPKLGDFNKMYPDINIHIHSHVELANFTTDGVDMAIRFGHQKDQKFHDVFLMKEQVFMVASPKLIKEKPVNKPKDLQKHILLHDEIDCHFVAYGVIKDINWKDFSELLQINISHNQALTFTNAHLVLQAAVTSQGIAIGRSVLIEDDIKSGKLVKVLPQCALQSLGYHMICLKQNKDIYKIKAFSKWILDYVRNNH